VELQRELLGALMRNAGNDPAQSLSPLGANWDTTASVTKRGRLLTQGFIWEAPVTEEPWTTVTPAQFQVDVAMVFQDGSSTDQGTIVIP
jgi:hypothetical protein